MKKQAILKNVLALVLLLALLPGLPALADLTPGHMDTGFDPGVGADDEVLAVAQQADGKVLIGGLFTNVLAYVAAFVSGAVIVVALRSMFRTAR